MSRQGFPWPTTSEDARHTLVLDRPIARPPSPDGLTLSDLTGHVELGPLADKGAPYEVYFEPTSAPDDPSGGFPRRTLVGADGSFSVLAMAVDGYAGPSTPRLTSSRSPVFFPRLLVGGDNAPASIWPSSRVA